MFTKRFFIVISILELLVILGLSGYIIYEKNAPKDNIELNETQMVTLKETPLYGKCLKALPTPVKDSGFVRLEVTLKSN